MNIFSKYLNAGLHTEDNPTSHSVSDVVFFVVLFGDRAQDLSQMW